MLRILFRGFALFGAILTALTIARFRKANSVPVKHLPPTDSTIKAAWIAFYGSIVGALITMGVAVVALRPAYRQIGESQRNSAVQAGQILRNRWRAAQGEFNILLKVSSIINETGRYLSLSNNDQSREIWISRHRDIFAKLKYQVLPKFEEIGSENYNAAAGVELPDLDRTAFSTAFFKIEGDILLDRKWNDCRQ